MPSRDLSLSLPLSFASNDLTMGEEGTARGRSHSMKTFRKITNFPWKRGNPSFIINTGLEKSCRLFRGNNVSSRGLLVNGTFPIFQPRERGSPPISIIFSTHHRDVSLLWAKVAGEIRLYIDSFRSFLWERRIPSFSSS